MSRPRLSALAGALLAAAGASLATPAQAQQVSCSASAAPLGFGVYDTLSPAATRVNGGVTLVCSLLGSNAAQRIGYTVALGPGSGSYAARTLRSAAGSDVLRYNAYLGNPGPGSVWGDGTGGSIIASGSITVNKNTERKPETIPMVGVIPGGQTVGAGIYADTLTVTVTWN